MMGTLKLYGMKAAYDEVVTTAIKRQHEPPKLVGSLLTADFVEKVGSEVGLRSSLRR